MSFHAQDYLDSHPELSNKEVGRAFLDELLADSRLYKKSKDYKELLEFVVKLRGFAPFNAMLLQIQKPGLSYAASRKDWIVKFRREPKEGARPLLILRPFGPVALVYDVVDTEGAPLPEDVSSFPASGSVSSATLFNVEATLRNKNISLSWVDAGDRRAGYIRVLSPPRRNGDPKYYGIWINKNHDPVIQFTTLAHELGHLYLGHLGQDRALNIPLRRRLTHEQQEIEAESVAYIVCRRNGISPKSQAYLSNFVDSDTSTEDVDLYQVMRATGQVELILNSASNIETEGTRYQGGRKSRPNLTI